MDKNIFKLLLSLVFLTLQQQAVADSLGFGCERDSFLGLEEDKVSQSERLSKAKEDKPGSIVLEDSMKFFEGVATFRAELFLPQDEKSVPRGSLIIDFKKDGSSELVRNDIFYGAIKPDSSFQVRLVPKKGNGNHLLALTCHFKLIRTNPVDE